MIREWGWQSVTNLSNRRWERLLLRLRSSDGKLADEQSALIGV